jgi:hypothetical protein
MNTASTLSWHQSQPSVLRSDRLIPFTDNGGPGF